MRALSPVEAAALIAVGGSVLAVVVPTFARNLRASHVSEATQGVAELATRAAGLADAAGCPAGLPEPAPWTPAQVARGTQAKDPPGSWEQPTWQRLEFGFEEAHAYSFAFEVESAAKPGGFRAKARGDLDGDAVTSSFEIEGRCQPGGLVERSAEGGRRERVELLPLAVENEIE
jgi:hypothetical protein